MRFGWQTGPHPSLHSDGRAARARVTRRGPLGFLEGGGDTGALLRAQGWACLPFGSTAAWPAPLRAAISLMLNAAQPISVSWGPQLHTFYNDAFIPIMGAKHPAILGQRYARMWSEVWDELEPLLPGVLQGGGRFFEDMPFTLAGRSVLQTGWFSFSYTPLRDDAGEVAGFMVIVVETTATVQLRRTQAFRLLLEEALRGLAEPRQIMAAASEMLGRHLEVGRCGYGEVDETGEFIVFERDWTDGVLRSAAGRHRVADFGDRFRAASLAGATIRIDDLEQEAAGLEWLAFSGLGGARARLTVPLAKDGRYIASLYVHQAAPRHWTDEEVALVRSVAEATWAAVERSRAETALRAMNETLESRVAERTAERDRLWRTSQDMLVVLDPSGLLQAVSPAVTPILGWSPEQMVGRSVFDFIAPEDLVKSGDALKTASDGKLPFYECRFLHADGGVRWLSWAAAPEGGSVFAIGRHVTAEKEAQIALERSQARLRTAFETSYQLQGLLSTDGVLLDANATSLAAIGVGLDAIVGKPVWETPWFSATPGMPDTIRAALAQAAAGEEFRQEVSIEVASGLRSYDLSLRPICDSAGTVIAIVQDAIDTTDRRMGEAALRQSQKMEAVGQLTGGLAHDFNNLLTGISGSLELLQTRMRQGRMQDLERYIGAAQGASRRAAALTHRLLAFSRQQTLDPKPTDVNRLMLGMEDLIRRTVGPAVAVEFVGAAGLWPTLVDPNQLENALLNLCINARDAMPDGGRLTVETANRRLDEWAARELGLADGHYISLRVSDTGCGMAPEVIRRAFDPFFTTKPIGLGTGLGLSMIYGFVQQSGGQVRIYSELGQGTTIGLYLPQHLGPVVAAEDPVPGALPRAEQGETVLVVDDEPTVRMLVTEVLEDLGYTAVEAGDGAAGLQILRSGVRIDLLITDVGLPGGMNGRQVADAGRAVRPGLKVLFITGYAENAVVGNGRLDPGMHVLTKPFAMEALASRIRDIINAGG